jgi:hypothetical protein
VKLLKNEGFRLIFKFIEVLDRLIFGNNPIPDG